MNKSFITNLIALLLILVGYLFASNPVMAVGLFAFSGAVTNWLAVHMLFEKVPGIYGSGVIPLNFESFKSAIKDMMMQQFFTQENIDRFLSDSKNPVSHFDLAPVLARIDFSPAFDRLVEVIMASSFGGMLGMFGGKDALLPLREPFVENLQASLIEISESETFRELLQQEIDQPEVQHEINQRISQIIDARLAELTPQMVKEIVRDMIKKHLGWLVVWGGVFGGIIGLASSLLL